MSDSGSDGASAAGPSGPSLTAPPSPVIVDPGPAPPPAHALLLPDPLDGEGGDGWGQLGCKVIAHVPGGAEVEDEESHEEERIFALRYVGIMDTPPEENMDRLAGLLRRVLKAPIALVSFVDRDYQWSKSNLGCPRDADRYTRRAEAFCTCAIKPGAPDVTVVLDTHKDERFRTNPQVTGPPYIRFYAGAPIKYTLNGKVYRLGTCCVVDTKPRGHMSMEDKQFMLDISGIVTDELNLFRLGKVQHKEANQQFITCAAHDLKTPLSAFRLAISLLKEEGLEERERRETLEQARVSCDFMNDMVENAIGSARARWHPQAASDDVALVGFGDEASTPPDTAHAEATLAHVGEIHPAPALPLAPYQPDLASLTAAADVHPSGHAPYRPGAIYGTVKLQELGSEACNYCNFYQANLARPIRLELDPSLPTEICSDGTMLKRCLLNYLTNACKHTTRADGQVVVRFRRGSKIPPPSPTCQSASALPLPTVPPGGDVLRVEVLDSGCGVPPDLEHKLFREAFVQRETPGTSLAEAHFVDRHGSGLGLYVTGFCVRLMNGHCGFERRTDACGSLFWFEVPFTFVNIDHPGQGAGLATPEGAALAGRSRSQSSADVDQTRKRPAPPASHAAAAAKHSGDGAPEKRADDVRGGAKKLKASDTALGKLLVVDDSAMILKMLCQSLSRTGFSVDTARNGEEAIAKMQETRYRAVIMDFLMPILDGITATKEFRQWEDQCRCTEQRRQRIIGVSANAEQLDIAEGVKAGLDAFLPKPLKVGDLLAII